MVTILPGKIVTILPGKAVMAKKPNGDGTHKKKARVVVCEISNRSNQEKRHVLILRPSPSFVCWCL